MMENGQTLTVRPQRSQGRLWRDFVLAAVGMLILQAALLFSEAVSWDYSVVVDSALALPLAVGALLCILWMNVLLWRLKSLTGDHDVGRYWIYCAIMAVLCWFGQNLDSGGALPMLIALVSTPFGPVGTLTAFVLDGARYRACCGASFVFCVAEVLYHQRLLRRHVGERAGDKNRSGHSMKTDEEMQDRRLGRCILAGLLWLGLHLFVAVENFKDSLYVTFDDRTYVWIAVYTAALLLLDVLLFFLNSPGAAKKWLRYWGFCMAVCGIVFLCQIGQVSPGLWAIFSLAATPALHYDPLWRMVFQAGSVGSLGCTALVCGAHMIYFFRLIRRGNREEDHGAMGK